MHWELWDIGGGNLVGHRASENEVLALVLDLVAKGWPRNVLSLHLEDESVPVEELPPPVTGEELVRRAQAAGSNPVRRTA
jgi:hypothetical protein